MLGSSRNWQTAGRGLAAAFHVLAPDLRNHGLSPHAQPMTYAAMEADLVAWLAARGLDRVNLVGHSMGGKVAMLFACRQPSRVEKLVVVDIAPIDYHWVGHREEFAAMNELDLRTLKSRAEAEARMEARVPSLALRKFLLTNLERTDSGGWKWLIDLPILTAALANLERNSLGPDDRFSGPTLFLTGGKSNYVQPTALPAIRRHFPAAQQVAIPEAGHNPHMDARETFVRHVLEFLA